MKVLFSAAGVVGSWLFLPMAAAACSCASPSDPCLAIKAAEVVFVGRATRIEPDSYKPPNLRPAMVRFEVAEILHGTVPNVIELRDGGGGSCTFGFRADRDYLVYARHREGAWRRGFAAAPVNLRTGDTTSISCVRDIEELRRRAL